MKSVIPSGYFGNSKKHIHYIKNFVEKNDIIDIYNFSKSIKKFGGAQNSEIWKNRVCSGIQIQIEDKLIYNKLSNIYEKKARIFIEKTFNVFLKPSNPSIVVWNINDEQPPHADKEHPDGSSNGTPFYDISSLIYINDDYAGGEIYFPEQNVEIKPSAGDFICFPGDKEYMHGVKKIISGKRFTIPLFFTAISKFN